MWTTDDRKKSLVGHEKSMGNFLMLQAEKRGINCRLITVLPNHVHCLVRLNSTQSISDIIQILKGSSSLWMNNNKFLPYKFKWEDEYFAFSLGYSQLNDFETYLMNQAKYHKTNSVSQEIAAINSKYQLNYK